MDSIKYFYGPNLYQHLVELKAERPGERNYASGYISDTCYKSKKIAFILFINGDRLPRSRGHAPQC